MEKLRVLQVNKLYYPETGGIEKTLQQLSEGLAKLPDIELRVLVCQKQGKGRTETINHVRIHRSGSLGVLSSVPISFSFFANFKKMAQNYDVIQFHLPFPLGDLACLLSGYKGKVVIYWHSDVVKQKYWMLLYFPIMKKFLQRADIILVGAAGIARGSQYLQPYLDKCRVVPFAVEDEVLNAGKQHIELTRHIQKDKITNFLFVGRLVYYKGCSILLDAFAKMENQKSHLTIVGSGILEENLKKQCQVLGISKRTTFCGYLSDRQKMDCFEKADVFVLPSIERSEAFALVQLEAMAYGIPVINTNLPSGVPEVSIHKETGLTVEPGDSDGLAEAMDWMAGHEEERLQMGIHARMRVEENYTQKLLVRNLKEIYWELHNNNGKVEDKFENCF